MPGARLARASSEPPCAELSAREGCYLLALQQLAGRSQPTTQVELARMMGVSTPTTHEMVGRLRALQLLEPRGLALTSKGTSAALVLASRRHAATLLAHDVLDLADDDAALEAARLAPSLSSALTRRLIANRRRG